MIKNTKISLKPDSNIRQEALNTLQYTLLLDCPSPILQKNISIPDLMNQCQLCCLKLFGESPYGVFFNFFGKSTNISFPECDPTMASLEYFIYSPDVFKKSKNNSQQNTDKKDKENTANTKNVIGFPTMILQHCILSSYHAILTDLIGNDMVTSYQIVNKIQKYGAHYLYENKRLFFQSDYLKRNNNGPKTHTKSSRASDFGKRSKINNNEYNLLKRTLNLFQTEIRNGTLPENITYRYQLQFAGLYYTFFKIPAQKWKWGYKKRTNKKTENNIIKKVTVPQLQNLINELNDKIFPHPILDSVDDLYHRHIVERCFNFNLIYCILNNLDRIKNNDDFSLSKNEIISIFNSSKNLPNTINRQYFIQYAFDQIYLKPESESDFWLMHFLKSEETKTLSNPVHFHSAGFERDKWVAQFSMFCNYMGQFVIPVYEWCFLNLLMESVELNNKDKTHEQHLQIAFELLSDYINTHTAELLQPLTLEKNKDWTVLNANHKQEICFITNDDITAIVSEIFFEKEDTVDLNLFPLNRSFFTMDRGKDSNLGKIHDFYIRLLSSILNYY